MTADFRDKRGPLTVAAIVLGSLSIVASIALLALYLTKTNEYRQIERRLSDTESQYLRLLQLIHSIQTPEVDLSTTSFQNIESNYAVSVKSVSEHLSGILVKGLVLNQNSVAVHDVSFTVVINFLFGTNGPPIVSTARKLSLPEIGPGHAAPFELYIPDVDPKTSRSAVFSFDHASVSYLPQ
jgi:hypothetical protein